MMAFPKAYPCFFFSLTLISLFCLMGKSPVNACVRFRNSTSEVSMIPEIDPHKIRITYTIRVGEGATLKKWNQITLTVPQNTSFHSIMKIASEKDSRFKFTDKKFSFGYYITSIGGIEEDLSKKLHWMLYRSPKPLLPEIPPNDELQSPVGVSDLRPHHGDTILFWYRTVDY